MNNLGLENFKRKFEEQEMFEPELFLPRYYGENLEYGVEGVNWRNVAKVAGGISIIGVIIAIISRFLGKGGSGGSSGGGGGSITNAPAIVAKIEQNMTVTPQVMADNKKQAEQAASQFSPEKLQNNSHWLALIKATESMSPSCKREWEAAAASDRSALMMKKLRNEPAKMFSNYEDVPKGLRLKLIYTSDDIKLAISGMTAFIANQPLLIELAKDYRLLISDTIEYVATLIPRALSGNFPSKEDALLELGRLEVKYFPHPDGVKAAIAERATRIFTIPLQEQVRRMDEENATRAAPEPTDEEPPLTVLSGILTELRHMLNPSHIFDQTGEMDDKNYQKLANFIRTTDSHSGLDALVGSSKVFSDLETNVLPKMLAEMAESEKLDALFEKNVTAVSGHLGAEASPEVKMMFEFLSAQLRSVKEGKNVFYNMLRCDANVITGFSTRFSHAIDDTLAFSKHYKHYNECLETFIKSVK